MEKHKLLRWRVTQHPGNATQSAYATVYLYSEEWKRQGFSMHRYQHSESYRIPLGSGIASDLKGNKALVRRAMAMSPNKWTGKP